MDMPILMILLVLSLLPTAVLLYLLLKILSHLKDQQEIWQRERESLLNRAMSKEWETFQMLETSNPSNSPSSGEPDSGPVGMNDAEELRRIGNWFGSQGIGEEGGLDDDDRDLLGLDG